MKKKIKYWIHARDKESNTLYYWHDGIRMSMRGVWSRKNELNHNYGSSCLTVSTMKNMVKHVEKNDHILFTVERLIITKSGRKFLRKWNVK